MLTTLRCPLCRFFTDSVEELEGHVRVKHLVSEVLSYMTSKQKEEGGHEIP